MEQEEEEEEEEEEEDLIVGKVFADKDEIFKFFEEYFRQTFQPFIRRVNSDNKVIFMCSRGRWRQSRSKGVRPNQHYLFTGCKAHINLFKQAKQKNWKVTLLQLKHNHVISREEYICYRRRSQLTVEDYEFISNLIEAKVKDSVIAANLKTKRGKFLTRKDVTNIRAKLFKLHYEKQEGDSKDFRAKDDDVGVGLESGPTEEIAVNVGTEHEFDSNLLSNDETKVLSKKEKYNMALEYFIKWADKLSNLGAREFFDCMEKMKEVVECLNTEIPALEETPVLSRVSGIYSGCDTDGNTP